MNAPRVAILSRSFWPVAGQTEACLVNWLQQLCRRGVATGVWTSQWQTDWPQRITLREVSLQRVPRPAGGAWAAKRFVRGLSRELASGAQEWDAVLVAGGWEEVEAAKRARDRGGPRRVLVRLDPRLWRQLEKSPVGLRKWSQVLNDVDACVNCEPLLQSVWEAVCPRVNLVTIPDWVDAGEEPDSTLGSRRELRNALSDLHPVMSLETRSVTGLYCTEFQNDAGWITTLKSWTKIDRRYPQARLWLAGDGPDSMAAWQRINELGVSRSAILPGSFDHVLDSFRAVDFYIHPDSSYQDTWALRQAAVLGVPVIYAESSRRPEWLIPQHTGLPFTEGAWEELAQAISTLVTQREMRLGMGEALQVAFRAAYRPDEIGEQWRRVWDVPVRALNPQAASNQQAFP